MTDSLLTAATTDTQPQTDADPAASGQGQPPTNAAPPAGDGAAAPPPEGGERGSPLAVKVGERDVDLSAFAGEDGALDAAKVAEAWAEAQDKLAAAAAPESYALNDDLVKAVTGGKGAEDPVMKSFLDAAKAEGVNQKQFDALLGFAKTMIDGHNGDAAEAQAAELSAVQKHFGKGWQGKLDGLNQWGEKTIKPLGEDLHQAFMAMTSTAAGVKLAEALMSGRVARLDTPLAGGQGAGAGGEQLTEAKLRDLMSDPKYWRDKDPALVRRVEEGFKTLYAE